MLTNKTKILLLSELYSWIVSTNFHYISFTDVEYVQLRYVHKEATFYDFCKFNSFEAIGFLHLVSPCLKPHIIIFITVQIKKFLNNCYVR